MAWVFVAAAIVTEVLGTLGLRHVATSAAWWSVALIVLAYAASFSCLTVALRQLNVGVVYAIWSAVGTAAISIVGVAVFGERLNAQAITGMALIVLGVVVLVGSGTVRHA